MLALRPRKFLYLFLRPAVLSALVGLVYSASSPAAAASQPVNDVWRMRIDPHDKGLTQGWAQPDLDDASWTAVKPGQSWSRTGYFGYAGAAWYRLRLEVPEAFRGQFLLFDSVGGSSIIYLDGIEVARHRPVADPLRRGVNPGAGPFRIRLPKDRTSVVVTLKVVGADSHGANDEGPGLTGRVSLSDDPLMSVFGYWLPPDQHVTRSEWLAALHRYRDKRRTELGVDGRIYRGPFEWTTRHFLQGFVFLFDTAFFDGAKGEYRIDAYLDDAERRFGGYDSILLWHGYPNIGVDNQGQFEMLRNLPGGIAGVRRMIARAQARGVKVFIAYSAFMEKGPANEALAEMVATLKADGVQLDIDDNVPHVAMRKAIDAKRLGVALQPENGAGDAGVVTINNSWGEMSPIAGNFDHVRGIPISKWTEPRHISQTNGYRWRRDRTTLVQDAFLNGIGVVVWENVFGTWNRWTDRDRALLRRMLPLQRHFADLLVGDGWEPLVTTLHPDVDASLWREEKQSLWTLANWSNKAIDGPALRVVHMPGSRYFDLWNGRELSPAIYGGEAAIALQVEPRGLGAIVAVHGDPDERLIALLGRSRAATPLASYPNEWTPPPLPRLTVPERTKPASRAQLPSDMALIPESRYFRMSITHNLGEGSCYPDEFVTDWDRRALLMYEAGAHGRSVTHDIHVPNIPAFLIDRTLVTKRDYQRFLQASDYRPADPTNFLKDWNWSNKKRPQPTHGLEDHPVVWVDLDDARAYARWAGKRLPTEYEWQYAAGGQKGRRYPWGENWQANAANDQNSRTTPVTAFPNGRTPEGVYDMSGNVWQWTESERDDGNRYAMLRGGSYFTDLQTFWYFDRYVPMGLAKGEHSARPTNYHAKLFLLSPSADRKATIGFRTVRDLEKAAQ